MSLSELHPDELLWRETCGTLTVDERGDLTAHLERCPACALERVVRMEAARARVPSEADHALAARLVDRVLATHERRPAAVMRGGRRRSAAVAAAAVVLLAGTAFGATALVVRARAQRAAEALALNRPTSGAMPPRRHEVDRTPGADGEVPRGDLPIARPAPAPRHRRVVRESVRAPARPLRTVALAHAPSGSRAPVPQAEPPHSAPARGADRTPASPLPPPSPAAPVPPSAPAESAPAVTEAAPAVDAAQVLRRAEQARTARQWGDAARAFVELGRRHAGTREEIVGRALYGQLLLDHLDEPRRALSMFDRYLAVDTSGTLAEEARLGRAQALRRLGRGAEERAAWLELLRQHPGSIHAAAARTRLAALDTP